MFEETKPPRTVLICCLRLMGDVLVTTPLAHSISNAFPGAAIDYLVFEGTGGILAKHPLVRNVIAIPKKGGGATVRSLFRKYDLAVAAYPSDRTAMAAAMAGRRSVGLIYREKKGWWKRLLLDRTCFCDDRLHVVSAMISLAHELGIPAVPKVSVGYDDGDAAYARERLPAGRYVLLHPYSMNRFKYWPQEQWQRLASLIQERTGCTAVFTVTPSPEDRAYLDAILAGAPAGVATFPSLTLSHFAAALERCAAYVGIDTATTHMAAAMEAPTIAIFGSTLTRYWAPWPNGCEEASPFAVNRGIQRKGYVTVVQKDWECVPCNRMECRISSRNRMECLEAVTAEEVLAELLPRLR